MSAQSTTGGTGGSDDRASQRSGAGSGAGKGKGKGKGGRRAGGAGAMTDAALVAGSSASSSAGSSASSAIAPVSPRPPDPAVAAALAEVVRARAGMTLALDDLAGSAQAALDVPAHIRRNPVKAAAVAGGAGFLLVGGPRRVLRAVGRRISAKRRDPYDGLLPEEVRRILRDTKVPRPELVEQALEADFAEYLRQRGRVASQPTPTAARSFWRTYDMLAGVIGTAAARVVVDRIVEAEERHRA